MKNLNKIAWFIVFFIIATVIIAIISKIYDIPLLFVLAGLNVFFSILIMEMIKFSFEKEVANYKALCTNERENLRNERIKLQETRLRLSNYIEQKIKMRKKIQDSLKKGFVFLFILTLFSCKAYKEKVHLSRYVESFGVVDAINYTKGYFVVTWNCAEPQFRKQPCYATSDHLIKNFPDVSLGDTLDLYLRKSFKY